MMGYKPMVIFVWDGEGGHPDQSLPPGLGGPVDPGYGVPGGGPRPDQGLPGRPPQAGQLPSRPGRPVDPGYGVGGSEPPIPVLPTQPIAPGGEQPSTLPAVPQGSFIVLWVPGKGYVAVQLGPRPDQGLPGGGAHPDQGLPPGAATKPTPPQPTPTPQGRR